MSRNPAARELLLDSEATLRLAFAAADDAAGQTADPRAGISAPTDSALAAEALPELMMRVYREIDAIVSQLRASRGALRRAAVEKLHVTSAKLQMVTSATEVAATDIMDSVDRALVLVDRLESREGADQSTDANDIRACIRDELFSVMTHLQFQDITTQQINHASAMLSEIEDRLSLLTQIFDPRILDGSVETPQPDRAVTYDPLASIGGQETRQALVDEIFQTP